MTVAEPIPETEERSHFFDPHGTCKNCGEKVYKTSETWKHEKNGKVECSR